MNKNRAPSKALGQGTLSFEWFQTLARRAEEQGIVVQDNLTAPIDYAYRPGSCWDPAADANRRCDQARQRLVGLDLLAAAEPVPEPKNSLPSEMKELFAALTGISEEGCRDDRYLPPLRCGEIEIARLTLASTTRDVISIRARQRGKRIAYRIADEYGTDYAIRPQSTAKPLTLQQLIDLIESAEGELGFLGLRMLQSKVDDGCVSAAEQRDFVAFSSVFYPGLAVHYWFAIGDWIHNLEQEDEE